MWKKQWAIIAMLLTVCLFLPTVHAAAAPELKVKVSAGFDGKAKYGKGAPILIEVENNGTSTFNGDMVIDTQQTYESGVGEVFPLSIEAGETKTVSFVVSKMFDFNMYGLNTKSIYFYEGGWKKGKEIQHKGSQQITVAMYHEDTKIITTFTDNVDRLSAVKGIRLNNTSSTQVIDSTKVASIKLPGEAAGWGPADIIIIDEYPVADLSPSEQESLVNWVRGGGIIVFGGSDHVDAEAGTFAEFLPLKVAENKTISPQVFNDWTKRKGFTEDIQIAKATLNKGATVIHASGSDILAASNQLGKGMVVQTAFSVGDEPFSKVSDATIVWNQILNNVQQSLMVGGSMNYYDQPMDSLRWTIGNANELFPSFKVSAPFIFGIIILYIIIIIPVLYFVLKRKDKREHAWWIIPAISIVVSVFIFAYGAHDRIGKAQIQQTSVFDVNQDGTMTGYFVESILTHKGGDFVFTAPRETILSTFTPYSSGFFGPSQMGTSAHKRAILEKDASSLNLYVRDVGYWDVATVFGQTTLNEVGTFAIDLTVKDKQLTGEITNNFPFPLRDVAIWSGTKQITVGDLGPGETVKVNETLKTSTLIRKQSSNSMYMGYQPAATTDDLMKMRKDSVLSFSGDFMNNQPKPVVIGYTDTKIIPVELEGTKASTDAFTMVSQAFTPNIEFSGAFSVDAEMMTMELLSEVNNMPAHSSGYAGNMYYFDEDVYIQSWHLPKDLLEKAFTWKSMDISKIKKNLYDVSILNIQTNEYEPLESETSLTIDTLDRYLTTDGVVKLKLDFINKQHGNEAQPPIIKLHGEVKK